MQEPAYSPQKLRQACINAGLPEPQFILDTEGVEWIIVTFPDGDHSYQDWYYGLSDGMTDISDYLATV